MPVTAVANDDMPCICCGKPATKTENSPYMDDYCDDFTYARCDIPDYPYLGELMITTGDIVACESLDENLIVIEVLGDAAVCKSMSNERIEIPAAALKKVNNANLA